MVVWKLDTYLKYRNTFFKATSSIFSVLLSPTRNFLSFPSFLIHPSFHPLKCTTGTWQPQCFTIIIYTLTPRIFVSWADRWGNRHRPSLRSSMMSEHLSPWTCFKTPSLLAAYGNHPHYFIIHCAGVTLSYANSKNHFFFPSLYRALHF